MLVTLITACFALAADMFTKHMAARHLTVEYFEAIPGLLSLQLRQNRGIALGMLEGNKLVLLVLPVVVLILCWLMLRRYHPTNYVRFAAGLILGGFLGNYIERVFNGYVLDMLYFPFLPWFVCNVADIAVCFGVALLVISLLLRPQDWREKNAED
ncbi:MAG: signal peptidase II [Clostridiales bacterium]|nr:signal peptidase II [Clostridiales bacterium]